MKNKKASILLATVTAACLTASAANAFNSVDSYTELSDMPTWIDLPYQTDIQKNQAMNCLPNRVALTAKLNYDSAKTNGLEWELTIQITDKQFQAFYVCMNPTN